MGCGNGLAEALTKKQDELILSLSDEVLLIKQLNAAIEKRKKLDQEYAELKREYNSEAQNAL